MRIGPAPRPVPRTRLGSSVARVRVEAERVTLGLFTCLEESLVHASDELEKPLPVSRGEARQYLLEECCGLGAPPIDALVSLGRKRDPNGTPVVWVGRSFDEPSSDKTLDDPTGDRRRRPDRIGQLVKSERLVVGDREHREAVVDAEPRLLALHGNRIPEVETELSERADKLDDGGRPLWRRVLRGRCHAHRPEIRVCWTWPSDRTLHAVDVDDNSCKREGKGVDAWAGWGRTPRTAGAIPEGRAGDPRPARRYGHSLDCGDRSARVIRLRRRRSTR